LGQLTELLPWRRWRPVASFTVRVSVIFCHDLKNKIAPDFIGLPYGIHVGFGLLNRNTFKQDAVQKAESCCPGIDLTVQQRFFVSITLHRICECVKIIRQRIRKINRDLHVLHPQSFHDLVFVRQRILIIGKRNIDNPLKPLVCNRLQLGFGGLSGAGENLTVLTEVGDLLQSRSTIFRVPTGVLLLEPFTEDHGRSVVQLALPTA